MHKVRTPRLLVETRAPLVASVSTPLARFQLTESQIRSLISQADGANATLSSSPLNRQQLPLTLHLGQLMQLCQQHNINIAAPSPSSTEDVNRRFNLSTVQLAHLIKQHNYPFEQLLAIEQNLRGDPVKAQEFLLSASQIGYLLTHHHTTRIHGFSIAQLIALHVLHASIFSLTYEQTKQLALMQSEFSISAHLFYDESLRYDAGAFSVSARK